MKIGNNVKAGIRCAKCKAEGYPEQMLIQHSIRKWEARADTPCKNCGSVEYESYVEMI